MNRFKSVATTLLTTFLVTAAGNAFAELTPTWSNATTDNDSVTDFDTGELTFERIEGNCLRFVDEQSGYFHAHGDATAFYIDVRVDNVWTTVFYRDVEPNQEIPLRSIVGVRIPEGLVDGVIMSSTVFVSNAFHSVNEEMQFDIDFAERCGPAPVPATSPLFTTILVLSLAGFGLFFSRRRRVTVA